jgi:glutathione S-transferase
MGTGLFAVLVLLSSGANADRTNMGTGLFAVLVLLSSGANADRIDALFEAGSYARSSTVEVSTGPSPAFHLDYLTLRGLAELPVLILEATNTPYNATYFSKEDFGKVKSSYPLGRLPVLSVLGDVQAGDVHADTKLFIAQSASIVRYLAERCQLFGMDTPIRRARVDFAYETVQELMKAVTPTSLGNKTESSRHLHYRDTTNRGHYSPYEKAAAALLTFEEMLGASGGNFLFGTMPSYADLALYLQLAELSANSPNWHTVVGTPKLAAFVDAIEAIGNIAAYLNSDRRMPRIEQRTVDGASDYFYTPDRFSRRGRASSKTDL